MFTLSIAIFQQYFKHSAILSIFQILDVTLVVFSSRMCFMCSQMLLKFLVVLKGFSAACLFILYRSLDSVYYLSTL